MQQGGDARKGVGLQATVNARPFVPGGSGSGGGKPGDMAGQPAKPGGAGAKPPGAMGWGPKGSSPVAGAADSAVSLGSAQSGKGAGPATAAGGRMSAGATSFVPKTTATPSGSGAPGSGDMAPKSPQQGPQHGGGLAKGLAPPLRSPGRPRPPAGAPAAFLGPSATGPRPASGRGAGRSMGRGMAGSRGPPLAAMPGGPGDAGDLLGSGRNGAGGSASGAKRSSLLAQHQANYSGAHGHYSAGQGRSLLAAQFMSEALRQQLQQNNFLVQSQWMPTGDEPALPDMVGHYHTLYPLEDLAAAEEHPSASLGVRTCVIKGISSHDGAAYALRRVDGKQVLPSSELVSNTRQAVDAWQQLSGHPGLVCPREVFVAADLDGSPALVIAHPYHPGAVTLTQAHLVPTHTASGQLVRNPPNEATLWSYTIQLASALRAVHAAGLATRQAVLSPTKVLLLPLGRLRIGSLGLVEALAGDVAPTGEDLAAAQRDDVVAMGQLLLTLACSAGGVSPPNLDYVAAHFSQDYVRCLALLLGAGEVGSFSWRHMAALTGERMMVELDTLSGFADNLVTDLSKEMENGRLLRLLVKLGFINERPEGDLMSQWSETGDRYILKLFRDFVFHQTDADGAPRLDWGHVVEALNKLDAGVQEQMLLLSRDEQSMLVASYGDVKRCVQGAFAELRSAAARTGR